MIDPSELIGHWGYPAIFVFALLGSAGVPVPEESILFVSGYLAWQGQLRLPLVVAVGIVSAALGDNLGYWFGHRYGRAALERYGHHIFITSRRLNAVQAFFERWGAWAVFLARFVPGLRAWAGPIAGVVGMRFLPFTIANALGAVCYVPLAVAVGYALGVEFGDQLERLRRVSVGVEYWALGGVLLAGIALLFWRATRERQ